ncbi:unnamed protein product [Rodentolepis nana]|uniref:Uncharacterized protein n=1 Tax=Rodentolepis nana TaxID=102285 RepID=A0A3P7V9T4_RODNA|nr:unnamed protein product [Rodentolepis nana]
MNKVPRAIPATLAAIMSPMEMDMDANNHNYVTLRNQNLVHQSGVCPSTPPATFHSRQPLVKMP